MVREKGFEERGGQDFTGKSSNVTKQCNSTKSVFLYNQISNKRHEDALLAQFYFNGQKKDFGEKRGQDDLLKSGKDGEKPSKARL